MTSRQWIEWNYFFSLEPFGEDRMDLRFGSVVQSIINSNRRKGRRAFSLEDCTLSGGDFHLKSSKKKKQTWQEMKAIAVQMGEI
jgi:hypothetical protein